MRTDAVRSPNPLQARPPGGRASSGFEVPGVQAIADSNACTKNEHPDFDDYLRRGGKWGDRCDPFFWINLGMCYFKYDVRLHHRDDVVDITYQICYSTRLMVIW